MSAGRGSGHGSVRAPSRGGRPAGRSEPRPGARRAGAGESARPGPSGRRGGSTDPARGSLPGTSAQRFAQRSARARAARRWRVSAVLAGVFLLAGVAWALLFSSLLAVSDVDVEGVPPALAREVEAAARAPLGAPLARVGLAPIEARVAALPPVASVRATRAWPRTLRLVVVPRRASAVLVEGSGLTLVDASGVPFAQVATSPTGLVPIRDTPRGEPLAAAVAVAQALPPALAREVTAVTAPSAVAVRLSLDGRTVVWGTPAQSVRKARVTLLLLGRPGRLIDVTAPDAPTVR